MLLSLTLEENIEIFSTLSAGWSTEAFVGIASQLSLPVSDTASLATLEYVLIPRTPH